MARQKSTSTKDPSATIGFEAKLWLAADKLRNNMDAAEYKHVVLELIFLRLAVINLAIFGIEADIGKEHSYIFRPALYADYILANDLPARHNYKIGDL